MLWWWERRKANAEGAKDAEVSSGRFAEGQVFRGFMAAYLGWRLAIDFLKPQPRVDGMNWIQWACVAGLVALVVGELRRRREGHDA
jgi:hypothetical protein